MSTEVSPGYNTGRVNLSQAPGADLDWDSLFPNPENPTALSPQATPGTTPQPTPQATSQNQPFLKAGETIYNSSEDAINGTIHKDQEIARMRSFLKDNGVDPNTFQRVTPRPQAEPQPQVSPRLYDRVSEAATKGDKDGYEKALTEFFQTVIEPYRPAIAEINRFKAVQQVSRELPGFKDFYENGGYQDTLNKNPLLKDMNQIGENDPVAAQRLPEVYRTAYFNYKGMQPVTPTAAPSTTQTTPTVQRPTLQSSSLTPPAPVANTSGWAEANWRGNKSLGNEARKQLIADGDTKFQGMRFEDVNL